MSKREYLTEFEQLAMLAVLQLCDEAYGAPIRGALDEQAERSVSIATIYVALGDTDAAFEWLERAYQRRSQGLPQIRVDAFLDPLRSDPRFQDLLRRIGFPEN